MVRAGDEMILQPILSERRRFTCIRGLLAALMIGARRSLHRPNLGCLPLHLKTLSRSDGTGTRRKCCSATTIRGLRIPYV